MCAETNTEIITTKLLHEAMNCPVAFLELVRQFGELDAEDREAWFASLTGVQAGAIYFTSAMMSEGMTGIALMLSGLDVDAANELGVAAMTRVGEVYGIETGEGADIPPQLIEDVKAYALEFAA